MADEAVNDHVRSVKRLLQLLILGCAFAVLIAFKTTTEKLMVNTGIISMPVLGSTLRTHSFYMAGPAALLVVWVYFLLRTHRLWEFVMARGGRGGSSSWIGLDYAEFHMGQDEPPLSLRLSAAAYVILAWLMVPATLGLLWFKYLPRHQMLDGIFPTPWLYFGLSIPVAIWSYHHAIRRLDRNPSASGSRTVLWASMLTVVFTVFLLLTQYCASYGSIWHAQSQLRWLLGISLVGVVLLCVLLARTYTLWLCLPPALVVVVLLIEVLALGLAKVSELLAVGHENSFLRRSIVADFRGLRTAGTSAGTFYGTMEEIESTGAVGFIGLDLRQSIFRGNVLIAANFTKADLGRADLKRTWLHNAVLDDADLAGAWLDSANLMGARLVGVRNLNSAHVKGTNIYGVRGLDSAVIDSLLCEGAVIQTQQVWAYKVLHQMERPGSAPCDTLYRFRQWERDHDKNPATLTSCQTERCQ